MSLTKTDIANLALGHLGVSLTISDVDSDTSAQAKVVRRYLNTSLEHLLERHYWGFATKIEALALVEECPNDSWGFSYRCPSDCLVIRKIDVAGNFKDGETYDDERNQFKEVHEASGILIYSDIGDAYAEYTMKVDEDEQFPNHFGRALAAQLALDIAPSIITNNFAKVRNVLLIAAERAINDGIAADLNRKPRPTTSDSRFVRARI